MVAFPGITPNRNRHIYYARELRPILVRFFNANAVSDILKHFPKGGQDGTSTYKLHNEKLSFIMSFDLYCCCLQSLWECFATVGAVATVPTTTTSQFAADTCTCLQCRWEFDYHNNNNIISTAKKEMQLSRHVPFHDPGKITAEM